MLFCLTKKWKAQSDAWGFESKQPLKDISILFSATTNGQVSANFDTTALFWETKLMFLTTFLQNKITKTGTLLGVSWKQWHKEVQHTKCWWKWSQVSFSSQRQNRPINGLTIVSSFKCTTRPLTQGANDLQSESAAAQKMEFLALAQEGFCG